MGLLNHLAKFAGETVRIKSNASKEKNLDPQTKQWIEGLIQRAQNGDINAMFELGGYYFKGEYVGYNPEQACFWWTEAANRGNVNAQYNLGLLYHGEISTRCFKIINTAIFQKNGGEDKLCFLKRKSKTQYNL